MPGPGKRNATEHEQKLRLMIEQSSNNINNALKDIITAEHRALDPNANVEYKPISLKEAFIKILETNKDILVEMFQEIIKGRILIYYLKMFPIMAIHGNLRIPWNEKNMLGIPNPMPTFYHYKTIDVDFQDQQDILLKNTVPYIARSIEASTTTVQ